MSGKREHGEDAPRGRGTDSRRDVPTEGDSTISVLLIPAPDQLETPVRFTISGLQTSTTVGEVRQRSRATIASRPDLGRLRLIYSGRLLARDDQTLEEVVGKETLKANRTVAIHLILRPLAAGIRPQPLTGMVPPTDIMAQHTVNAPPPQSAATSTQTPVGASLQPAPGQDFPPRPSSTPAMAHTHGPYAAPGHAHGQNGFVNHGMPNAQQAQFIQQLQQQHLTMMQAMLRQAPGHSFGTPGHSTQPSALPSQGQQMTLPDFQRLYNHQAQARQAQQQAASGRTTPQNGQHAGRVGFPSSSPGQTDVHNSGDASLQPSLPGAQRGNYQQSTPIMNPGVGITPRVQTGLPILPPGPFSIPLGTRTTGLQQSSATGVFSGLLQPEHETVYLLSSPAGHEAILLGPRNAHYSQPNQSRSSSVGPAPPAVEVQPQPAAVLPHPGGNDHAIAQPQARALDQPAQVQDLVALAMPLGGQLWLIIRLVGVVVLLTLNATWARTLIVWIIALIIYLAQTDVLNPIQRAAEQVWVPMRRHIEDLVRDVEDQNQAVQGRTVSPEQAAERLLRRQREQGIVRRIERSVALFVASFVPGVGEAQVAAREATQRQRLQEARDRDEASQRLEQSDRQDGHEVMNDAGESGGQPQQPESLGPSGSAAPGDHEDGRSLRHRQPQVEDANEQEP